MKEIYPGDTRAAIVIGRAEEVQKAMEEKLSQMTLADVKKDVAACIEKEQ